MSRTLNPLLVLAAVAVSSCLAVAPAQATVVSMSPANGAVIPVTSNAFTRSASVPFQVTTAEPSISAPDLLMNTTGATDATGALITSYQYFVTLWGGAGLTSTSFSGSWPTSTPGTYHWQLRETDCSAYPCQPILSPIQTFTVTDPPKVISAPQLTSPAAGATITAGEPVALHVTDSAAEHVTVTVRDAAGKADPPLAAELGNSGSDWTVTWTPLTAGKYTWQPVRTGCSDDLTDSTPIDCASQAVASPRPLTVVLPKPTLKLKSLRRIWWYGALPASVTCSARPCALTLTASAGSRRLAATKTTPKATTVNVKPAAAAMKMKLVRGAEHWLNTHLREGSGHAVKVTVKVSGTDALGQKLPSRRATLTLKARPKSTPPSPADKAAERNKAAAEQQVVYNVTGRFELARDEADATCTPKGSGFTCDWSTSYTYIGSEHCYRRGSAEARRSGGSWSVRLYDLSLSC